METEEILAWHFIRSDKKLGYGDGRDIVLCEKLTVDPDKLEICNFGLHGSIKILEALSFVEWENAIVCRVKLGGKIIEGDDKIVASERTVIGWCEADKLLHEFACRVAEDVLPLFEKEYPEDSRPRKAIEAKRLWLEGKLSNEDLQTASDAAWSAAWDAAWSAASDAAWSAASATANYAASAAARSVANYAARSVARDAAWSAARYAANYAARDAAYDKYNSWLEDMVMENIC